MNKKTKQLMRQNNLFETTLNKENREVLTDIIVYLRDCNISLFHQEEVRRDIMNMLADGEKRKEDASTVLGSDFKVLCSEIVSSLPVLTIKEKVLLTVSQLLLNTSIILGIYFVRTFVDAFINKEMVTNLPLTVGDIINGILIILFATFTVKYICKTSFVKNKKLTTFLASWVLLTVVFVGLVAIYYFLSMVVVSIHLLLAIGIILGLYILSRVFGNVAE